MVSKVDHVISITCISAVHLQCSVSEVCAGLVCILNTFKNYSSCYHETGLWIFSKALT